MSTSCESYGIIAVYTNPRGEHYILITKKCATIHFICFVRGYYPIANQYEIYRMFTLMTKEEKQLIYQSTFDDLWKKCMRSEGTPYQRSYAEKFYNQFRKDPYYEQYFQSTSVYDKPEWEFPKGRKLKRETNLNAALREFHEETQIPLSDLTILPVDSLEETIIGTNKQTYTNTYFICKLPYEAIQKFRPNGEMQAAKWVHINHVLKKFRPYHQHRETLLSKLKIILDTLVS